MDKGDLQRMYQIQDAEHIIALRKFPVRFSPITIAYGKEMVLWDIYDEEECPVWDSFGITGGCFVHRGKYHASYRPLLYNDTYKVHPSRLEHITLP